MIGIKCFLHEGVEERQAQPGGDEFVDGLIGDVRRRNAEHTRCGLVDDRNGTVMIDHHQPAFHIPQNVLVVLFHPGDFFVQLSPFQRYPGLVSHGGEKLDILREEGVPG